ncbi:hypothetical protein FA13DRAFT_1782603 [Coprinellus micaceus]|uniref:Uncharacterized protein n=1 Tax=Coprinellus micaceus TaxID=71717 RepID=A0A4Y7RZE9_COPMI|nr:hypothetical protein FA13DRAFT_1782603 [Coprinellus micaceus]
MSDTQPEGGYPPQLHTGKVGYGPNYHMEPTLGEKYEGLKEEVKGKVKRNPEQVQHGKDMISGESKRREREADMSSGTFGGGAKEDDPPAAGQPTGLARNDHKGQKEQASTVAPVGHPDHDMQRKGEAVDRVKHIG